MYYKVFESIKVIEYGNYISAPFCAKIIADLGAEVVKIEDPNCGDVARKQEPFLNDIPSKERSGLFQYLNMNKLGITLNLRTKTGKEIFCNLIRDADIFIENISPRKAEKLGISYKRIKNINPNIVMSSITPFGQTGPYKYYKSGELLNAHMGGLGYIATREVDISREPIKAAANILSFQAGLSAAAATIGCLYHHSISGQGAHIDISEQECVIQNLAMPLLRYCYGDVIVSRTFLLDRAPFHILPCKDGYIYHAFMEEYQWANFLKVMGNPDWGNMELFKDYPTRALYWDALKPLILEWTMEHTVDEIYHSCQENGAPIGAVYTAKDVVNSRQLDARNFFADVKHKECGFIKQPGVPYKLSELNRKAPLAAPAIGQHNEQIYCNRLGYSKNDLVKLKQADII